MNASEKELQNKMADFFRRYFKVYLEVWSTDRKRRIDLILIHLSDFDKKYPIGIEIKIDDKKKGKELALWLKQSSDYSTKMFEGFGKCLIVTYPQVSGLYLNEGTEMNQHIDEFGNCRKDHNIATFLSTFGVGELQKYKRHDYKTKQDKEYVRIVYLGQSIWDMYDDELKTHNYDRLCR